jgi:N-acyl-D-amino-acid deacylase
VRAEERSPTRARSVAAPRVGSSSAGYETRTTAGASDAGAHLLSFCGVDYTTRLLTEWVPDVLSFEQAVSRRTMVPARLHGMGDRGVIKAGAAADLNVIDRNRLASSPPRYIEDFPASSGRFVIDAEGYVATIVNGAILMQDGKHTGALPGRVLRGTEPPVARSSPNPSRVG